VAPKIAASKKASTKSAASSLNPLTPRSAFAALGSAELRQTEAGFSALRR
jgi:hypothetical protein